MADFYEQRIDHSSHYAGRVDKSNGRVYRLRAADAEPGRYPGDVEPGAPPGKSESRRGCHAGRSDAGQDRGNSAVGARPGIVTSVAAEESSYPGREAPTPSPLPRSMAPARELPYNARETGRAAVMLPVGSEVNAMKAVVGFFDAGATQPARDALLAGGFRPDQVRLLAAADELPPYLEGEPEKSASRGWLAGSIAGALVGALGGWLLMVAFDLRLAPPLAVLFLLTAFIGCAVSLTGYLIPAVRFIEDELPDEDRVVPYKQPAVQPAG